MGGFYSRNREKATTTMYYVPSTLVEGIFNVIVFPQSPLREFIITLFFPQFMVEGKQTLRRPIFDPKRVLLATSAAKYRDMIFGCLFRKF